MELWHTGCKHILLPTVVVNMCAVVYISCKKKKKHILNSNNIQ